MKKYRRFSADFKRQVVAQIDSGEVSLGQAARDHDVSPSLIARWREQIHGGTFVDRPSPEMKAMQRELDRYKKKVAELLVFNDILKKANEISRRRKKSSSPVVYTMKLKSPSEGGAK
jgi:transposase-like protein